LVIDVVGSLDVLGVAVVFVGHGGRWWMNDGGVRKYGSCGRAQWILA
jgi:hypothetical protein